MLFSRFNNGQDIYYNAFTFDKDKLIISHSQDSRYNAVPVGIYMENTDLYYLKVGKTIMISNKLTN